MDSRKRITLSWSGGKDAAYTLFKLLNSDDAEVVNIHTIINKESSRVGMHGIREGLIEEQARSIGLPLVKAYLSSSESNLAYENLVSDLNKQFVRDGITHIAYGDLFLEDLKIYRENLLIGSGLEPLFPIWKTNSEDLIREFTSSGHKAVVCASNEICYKSGILGTVIGSDFCERVPATVDPCGENGEFHSFVFDGPLFKSLIAYQLGDVLPKSYSYMSRDSNGNELKNETTFYFQEIVPM